MKRITLLVFALFTATVLWQSLVIFRLSNIVFDQRVYIENGSRGHYQGAGS